jgi:predicted dithiol-disulfide oxidoreductase (DUF899 family)
MPMTKDSNPGAARPVVSRDERLRARMALFAREKEWTRQRDEIARPRRDLPWVGVENDYQFQGPGATLALADLFRGRSQLIVHPSMFAPNRVEGCPSSSFVSDHVDGSLVHLENREVSLTAVSRAAFPKDACATGKRRRALDVNASTTMDSTPV